MRLGETVRTIPPLELPDAAAAELKALKPGQIITVTAERNVDGRLLARLGRLQLPLPEGMGIEEGEELTLRVAETNGRVTLQVITRDPPRTDAVTEALRRDLPAQGSPAQALRNVRDLLTQPSARLPPPVRAALEKLLALAPPEQRLSDPEGLRMALRDSGVLLEPLLARAPSSAADIGGRDLKAQLARVATRIRDALRAERNGTGESPLGAETRDALTRLGGALDAAVSRIHVLQLHSVQSQARLDFAAQLPITDGTQVHDLDIRIREDDAESGTRDRPGSAFSVTVRFSFADAGPLEARIRLAGERISVSWWTDSEAMESLIRASLPVLSERLEVLGLGVDQLMARRGEPPAERTEDGARPGGILDERA